MGILKIVAVVLLAVIVQHFFKVYNKWGGFARYNQHYPGPCQRVEGIQPGSEDFHTLSNGQTFISSGLRYMYMAQAWKDYWKRQSVKGRIYLMDLNDPDSGVKDLKISSTPNFNVDTFGPHGISVWEDKRDGRHVVFVVNHPFGGENIPSRVEKFEFDPVAQELLHLASFSDPAMKVVNDVQATGENSFYFTNTNYFYNIFLLMLEIVLELPLGDVVHFDGNTYTVVDGGFQAPNGITMSADGKFVYVAGIVQREIAVYKRDARNNSLTRVQSYPVYSWPDNLQVDKNKGRLFVGLHPIPFTFLKHGATTGEIAPSQVLQLALEDGLITSAMELFYDHGELISGSSSATVHNGTLLIGSVLDSLVTCSVYIPLL